MDNRDSKGRFKRKEENDEDDCGVFNRAPTLKMTIILILLTLMAVRWMPSSSDLKHHGCNAICWQNPNQTLTETEKLIQNPSPTKPKL